MNSHPKYDILLVEDDPSDAELIIRTLKKLHPSIRIGHLADGAEALDFLDKLTSSASRNDACLPKSIFLDIKLPKVGGLEVLRQIKAGDCIKNIPVVIITSSGEDPDIKLAYDLGANGYVIKPVSYDQFLEVIRNTALFWLRINEPPRGTMVTLQNHTP